MTTDQTRRRPLPLEAAFMLGSQARDEGFVQFLIECRDDGFVLEQPEDAALTEDEWQEIANQRVRVLVGAWEIYKERQHG